MNSMVKLIARAFRDLIETFSFQFMVSFFIYTMSNIKHVPQSSETLKQFIICQTDMDKNNRLIVIRWVGTKSKAL